MKHIVRFVGSSYVCACVRACVYHDARYRKRTVYCSVERNPSVVRSLLTAQWWRYRALRFFLSKSLISRAARGQC